MSRRLISGSAVALITPFKADESIDEPALRRLVKFQIAGGTDILIPCGTTGESPTLSSDEQRRVIEIVVDEVKVQAQSNPVISLAADKNKVTAKSLSDSIRVMAGAGSNSTHHAVELTKAAEQAGATGILSVAPYYNKPTQEGFTAHYKTIAAAMSLPIIIYNVPGRAGSNINPDTLCRLADEVPNIVAVKEASAQMTQITELLRNRPDKLAVLSGDDFLTLPMMALGGDGIISVLANEVPQAMKAIVEAMFAGNLGEAQRLHNHYLPLMTLNFIESNPMPAKYVLSKLGLIDEVLRSPMVKTSASAKAKLDAEMKRLGLAT